LSLNGMAMMDLTIHVTIPIIGWFSFTWNGLTSDWISWQVVYPLTRDHLYIVAVEVNGHLMCLIPMFFLFIPSAILDLCW
jgi:hypothetical protein